MRSEKLCYGLWLWDGVWTIQHHHIITQSVINTNIWGFIHRYLYLSSSSSSPSLKRTYLLLPRTCGQLNSLLFFYSHHQPQHLSANLMMMMVPHSLLTSHSSVWVLCVCVCGPCLKSPPSIYPILSIINSIESRVHHHSLPPSLLVLHPARPRPVPIHLPSPSPVLLNQSTLADWAHINRRICASFSIFVLHW